MKLISIQMSNDCIQQPRCSFCYLSPKKLESNPKNECKIREIIKEYDKENITICLEYNGFNLSPLLKYIYYLNKYKLTMTTMPLVITDTFCGCMKSIKIEAISLSYDSEKCKTSIEWCRKGKIVKENKIQLACNFLIEKIPFEIPIEILKISEQLNLLSLKPLGKYSQQELDFINLKIEQLKPLLPIVVDNCLGVQLGLIKDCRRGKDFIHINIDSSIDNCCFKEKCFLFPSFKGGLR